MFRLSTTCMGIFPFTDSYKSVFDTIVYPVIQSNTGLACEDARKYYEPSHVKMELIANMIREARLLVVDISEKNPNVFFEFGIGYSLHKPMIILCSKDKFKGEPWCDRPPFDIQGLDLLIYDDRQDLRLKLGRYGLDALYETKHVGVSWRSDHAYNHVKSATSLYFVRDGLIWANEAIHESFTIRYKVTIKKRTNEQLDPDIRLIVAAQNEGFPRVVVIFPWELREKVQDMWECHVDYVWADESVEPHSHKRIQQIPMARRRAAEINEHQPLTYDFSVTFSWPNMVVESTFFDDKREQLMVAMRHLQALGYPVHQRHFIGFGVVNGLVQIDEISIKEIDLG